MSQKQRSPDPTYRYIEVRAWLGPWGVGWGREVRPKPLWWGPVVGRHYSGFRLGLKVETWRTRG